MREPSRPRRRFLLSATLLIGIGLLSLGYFANPPNGYTGAPGDDLCSDCHSLSGGIQNGNITVTGFPANIIANQTYTLSVTVYNPNGLANFAGFQMVILDAQNSNAGTMSNAGPNSTIQFAGGRSYHEHNPAQMFDVTNSETWTVDWTAPPGSGVLTYYAAGNVANGNGNTNGDLIVTTNGSGFLETPLTVMITDVSDVTCFGLMDGSITAEAAFGMPGYTYAWSNGGSGETISGLGPGDYTVTVTDNAGATATASAEVLEPPLFQIVSTIVDHVSCNGGNDGQIILTLDGGVPPYPGAQGDIFTLSNLQAGDHTVMVSDANGCLISEEFLITEPEEILIETPVIIEPECAGEATGLITVDASGGTGSFEYDWSNGETSNSIQNLEAGVYSVTVTDDNGCTTAETILLDEPDLLTLELVVLEDVSCFGAHDGQIIVDADGGTGDYLFQWSNGDVGMSLTGLGPGTYIVTVSDDNDCQDTQTFEILEPTALQVAITGTGSLDCFGESEGMLTAQPAGGVMPYTYLWSNGMMMQTLTGLSAGVYGVTVTDVHGCTSTAMHEITQPSQIMSNASSTNETAPGAMDGTAMAQPTGGTGGYSFLWSTGDTTALITGLGVGIYVITVTDSNGCTATQSVNVSGTNCTLAATIVTTDALCFGELSGTAQVMVSGAMGSTEILWSTTDTTELIVGLGAGTYHVTVTDSEGCLATATATVMQPAMLSALCTVTHETAENANDGTISCMASGGTMPFTYLWSNGDTTPMIANLAPGKYYLTITDVNQCIHTDSATVNAFACALQLSVSSEDVGCFGESTGSAMITATGGTPPYQYAWSHGDTGRVVSGLTAGVYEVTVTDAQDCASEISWTIQQPDILTVVVDSLVNVSDGNDGAIFITVTGGTPPYSFIWTRNGGLVSIEEDITGLPPGLYEVEVSDANDCMAPEAVTVNIISGTQDHLRSALISVYPNPASEVLLVKCDPTGAVRNLYLMTTDGKVLPVEQYPADGQGQDVLGINIEHLAPGVYYLGVTTPGGTRIVPFVK